MMEILAQQRALSAQKAAINTRKLQDQKSGLRLKADEEELAYKAQGGEEFALAARFMAMMPGGQPLIPLLAAMDIAEGNYLTAAVSTIPLALKFIPKTAASAGYLTAPARAERFENAYAQLLMKGVSSNRDKARMAEFKTRIELMKKGYLKQGSGIHNGSGHGIDAVYKNVKTGEIAVVESKWVSDFTSGRSIESTLSWGYGHRQMSKPWVNENIKLALKSDIAEARRMGELLQQGYCNGSA